MTVRKGKRRKKSAAARLRPFWFLLVLVALAASAAGYWAATWPGFDPRHVAVTGNQAVSSEEILARAQIEPSRNVWLQNMKSAARRVSAIPYVGQVTIVRSLPAGVTIRVTERKPFAVLRFGPHAAVADRDLRILRDGGAADDLPLFVLKSQALPAAGVFVKDPQAAHLRDDYDILTQAHVPVAQLHYDKFGDLAAVLRSGVALLLGDESDLSQKAALVEPILSQAGAGHGKIAAVDLRAPKTPVVRYGRPTQK